MNGNSVDQIIVERLKYIFDHPDHRISERELEESILAMRNYLKIVYRPMKGYYISFYHEDNPFHGMGGLYEIIFYNALTEHQLIVLKMIGGDFVKLYVADPHCDLIFFNNLIEKRFPESIDIDIQKISISLADSIRQLLLSKLIVTVRDISFHALESLLSTKCLYFKFEIQRLTDMPNSFKKIQIFPYCNNINIKIEKKMYSACLCMEPQVNGYPLILLKMDPPPLYQHLFVALPDCMKLEFRKTTTVGFCSLREKNLTRANIILNLFSAIKELKLDLINGDGLYLLSNNPQISNLKTLELDITKPMNMAPKVIASSLSLLQNLRILRLNLNFLPITETPPFEDSEEAVFDNLIEFEFNTNRKGFELLDSCQFSNKMTYVRFQGYTKFPRDFVLHNRNIKTLILESITSEDDWFTLLSCPNLKDVTILQPLRFFLTQNTPCLTLRALSIKFYPKLLPNTVFNLPGLQIFELELMRPSSFESQNIIYKRISCFFRRNITNKMDQTLIKIVIIDNIGVDPSVFVNFRFKNLSQFHYVNDLLNLRDFDFYVQFFFKNTLSERDITIFVRSRALESGFAWRIIK